MYYIGIDVGGTNLKAGLVDESGKILEVERYIWEHPESGRDRIRWAMWSHPSQSLSEILPGRRWRTGRALRSGSYRSRSEAGSVPG